MTTEGSSDVSGVSADEFTKVQERARKFEAELVDTKKKLAAFDGVDLPKLKAIAEDYDNLRQQNATKAPEDLKKWKDETTGKLRAEVQGDIDKLNKTLEALKSENRELKIVDRAFTEMAPRFNEDTTPFIKQLIRTHVDIDDDGDYVIKDEKGEVRYAQGSPGRKMSLDDFASEIFTKHPSFGRATVPAGGKQPGVKGAPAPGLDAKRYAAMTPQQRAALPAKDRQRLSMEILKTRPVSSRP